jgi:SAM-dependent methyltransferase
LTAVASSCKARALELFAGIPEEYDAAGALLSFGQDPRWRRALVAALALAPTDRVLDVATGTGLVAAALIERHGCSVVAVDQSEEMLARARAPAHGPKLPRAASCCAARPSGCRSPTARWMRSPSPISCATSTIPAAYCEWLGS